MNHNHQAREKGKLQISTEGEKQAETGLDFIKTSEPLFISFRTKQNAFIKHKAAAVWARLQPRAAAGEAETLSITVSMLAQPKSGRSIIIRRLGSASAAPSLPGRQVKRREQSCLIHLSKTGTTRVQLQKCAGAVSCQPDQLEWSA